MCSTPLSGWFLSLKRAFSPRGFIGYHRFNLSFIGGFLFAIDLSGLLPDPDQWASQIWNQAFPEITKYATALIGLLAAVMILKAIASKL
jgi:hypothetical protein